MWDFHHNQGEAYLCGPNALKNVLLTLKASPAQLKVAQDARSGPHGFSLTQLAALADKAHLKYTLIKRAPGEPIPVPSIINWKVHHYAAITGMQGGKYVLQDPTFGDAGMVLTPRAIDEGSSGYFLVPAQARAKTASRTIAANSAEAGAVYGMGSTTNSLGSATGGGDCNSCPCSTPTGNQSACAGQQSSADTPPMTVANAHKMVVSLHLSDTPVGYKPQKGSPVLSFITYNQREAEQPAIFAFSNVSHKWSFSWMSYIQDDPANVGSNVMRVMPGGGGYQFPNSYNTACGCWAETPDFSLLYRIPISGAFTRYEHRLPDGSIERFSLSDGATTYPRKVFLTSIVDPRGNTTTLNYDSSFRLTSVVDGMGRSTTFTYGLTSSPLLLTQITDPFGRTAQLTYDTSGRLTDPAFGSIAPTYNGLNQVTAFNTNTYSYDNNGNTLSDGLTKNYKWDAENRLIEIDYIGSTAKSQFQYDGKGRRTVDIETDALGNVTTKRFLWCGSRICQVRDGTDTVQARILDEGEFNVLTSQKTVYMPDQLGSVRDVLDATTGNLISSIDYSPYGKITQSNGSFTPFYQYAGLAYHPQSTLLLSATRALDQSQHWLNRDLIREWGGINPYAYAGVNPINNFDPDGLCAQPDKKALCQALLASIQAQYGKLVQEMNKYDPNTDWMGGFPISPKKGGGFTKPGGHYRKIGDLQRGLRNRLQQYLDEHCEDDDSQGVEVQARFLIQ